MIENVRLLRSKLLLMTCVLVFCYLWIPPLIMAKLAIRDPFYGQYNFNENINLERIFCSIAVILVSFVSLLCMTGIAKLQATEDAIRVNRTISIMTVGLMLVSSIPLFYGYFYYGFSDRTSAFAFISTWRHDPIISALFTIALVSSLIAFVNGSKIQIIIIFAFVAFPELLYGTRVSMFRLAFLLAIFLPWNWKYLLALLGIIFITGMSRVYFNEYSSSSLYDYLILFLGDPANIALGTSFLAEKINFTCGIDGIHFVRSFLPPVFGIRDSFNEYFGDVTKCINQNGFGVGAPNGLGGSPINDYLVAPISFCMSTLSLLAVIISVRFCLSNRFILIKYYTPLIVISCLPYIMRNGMIATANHIITVTVWVLVPIFVLSNYLTFSLDKIAKFYKDL